MTLEEEDPDIILTRTIKATITVEFPADSKLGRYIISMMYDTDPEEGWTTEYMKKLLAGRMKEFDWVDFGAIDYTKRIDNTPIPF